MEDHQTSVEELFYKVKEYGDTRLDLFKLKAINKVSGFLSTIITSIVVMVFFFLVLLCITIGLALLIGHWLGNSYWGFFIIGGVFLLAGLLLFSVKNKLIKTPISDTLIKELID